MSNAKFVHFNQNIYQHQLLEVILHEITWIACSLFFFSSSSSQFLSTILKCRFFFGFYHFIPYWRGWICLIILKIGHMRWGKTKERDKSFVWCGTTGLYTQLHASVELNRWGGNQWLLQIWSLILFVPLFSSVYHGRIIPTNSTNYV